MFCSPRCVKIAWRIRRHPNAYHSNPKSKQFWKSQTGIGFKWEKYIAKKLNATHLEFNSKGADLDWNGKSVDVKACHLYKRKMEHGKPVVTEREGWWVFNRGKIKPIDYFCCVCLIKEKPKKILLIPNKEFSQRGIVVGWNSSYDVFKI